eukprot:2847176-Pleurochrysis_carterae.AAC.2
MPTTALLFQRAADACAADASLGTKGECETLSHTQARDGEMESTATDFVHDATEVKSAHCLAHAAYDAHKTVLLLDPPLPPTSHRFKSAPSSSTLHAMMADNIEDLEAGTTTQTRYMQQPQRYPCNQSKLCVPVSAPETPKPPLPFAPLSSLSPGPAASAKPPSMPPLKVAQVTPCMHVHSACAVVKYQQSPISVDANLQIDWTNARADLKKPSEEWMQPDSKGDISLGISHSQAQYMDLEATGSASSWRSRWRRGLAAVCLAHTFLTTMLFWLCVNGSILLPL